MTDPRERIETERITCEANTENPPFVEFWVRNTRRDSEDDSIVAPWPEVVELAQKILAADEEWLDSQTPTLEELRARYPEWSMLSIRVEDGRFRGALDIPDCPGGAECRWTTGPWGTERDALRWLAAKLEELGDGK